MEQRAELASLADLLKARPGQLAERVQALHGEIKKLRKASEKAAPATGADLVSQVKEVNGRRLLAARLDGVPIKALRGLMDTVEDGKVGLLVYVSKDLHNTFTAPALIKEVAAPCGGSGGGRPDMAQAGGTRPEGLEAAFALLHQRLLDA